MTILPVVVASAALLIIAYFTYGRLVARWLGLDPARRTPAVEMEDGNDFVPAPAGIVLGGHFTAIAAAGPVVGPIMAGIYFGWAPALIWILLGAIFIGGVHDAGSLFASIRHKAASITQVVRQHMSRPAYVTFLLFVWISLVYVVIAFADVTAGTFARFQQFDMLIGGQSTRFPVNGGAVAIGAAAYLMLSVAMGLVLRFTRIHWSIPLALCVVLMAAIIWKSAPMAEWLAAHGWRFMSTAGLDSGQLTKRWDQALLIYCFMASVVPMWLLLQPRGLIGATFLYAALLFGLVGTLIGGWSTDSSLAIRWPAFTGFQGDKLGYLFPFLFITIACGACSGFHSIVASGTTSKQIRRESDIRPIGYGAMLLEAMVAVFSLTCVMVLMPGAKVGSPDAVYARGIGNFMGFLGIDVRFAVGFGLLAFSSFVFDTMDVCTRLGRYVFQEITGLKGLWGGMAATFVTLVAPSIYLARSPAGSFLTFWTIFGTSNQLLAALTLVGVSVWLWRSGRPVWFALIPAFFMLANTGTALVLNFRAFWVRYSTLRATMNRDMLQTREMFYLPVNMVIAAVLLALGLFVVAEAFRGWRTARREGQAGSVGVAET